MQLWPDWEDQEVRLFWNTSWEREGATDRPNGCGGGKDVGQSLPILEKAMAEAMGYQQKDQVDSIEGRVAV